MKPISAIGIVLFAWGLLAGGAQAEFLAYAVIDGTRAPLPESVDAVDATHLADLEWDYLGGRSLIEVQPVEDARGDDADDAPLAGIGMAVAEAIQRTGRFVVRDGASGSPGDGYVLSLALTEYVVQVAGAVLNPRAMRSREQPADGGRVAIDLRLIDAEGRALVAGKFAANVRSPRSGVAGFGDVEGLPGGIWSQSIGQAILAVANQGAFEIVKAAGPLPMSGRIVRAEENRVWINLGKGSVSIGDRFEVTSIGETLVDPETGLELGALEETIGTVRVSQVEDRFSIAETLSMSMTPSRGDSVRSASPEFRFAPDWNPPASGLF